jgi:hypothetical protein
MKQSGNLNRQDAKNAKMKMKQIKGTGLNEAVRKP